MEDQITDENTLKAVVKCYQREKRHCKRQWKNKKCTVVFGIKKRKMQVRFKREKQEKQVKDKGEGKKLQEETVGVVRNGKCTEGGHRPMKIRFKTQTVEDILPKSQKLANKDEYKIYGKKTKT